MPPGHLDLAVNVHPDPPPGLREVLAGVDVTAYPDQRVARAVVAQRHGVDPDEVLLVNGAAEAFWALAHALAPRSRAALVHPSFTAPEAALRSAGHDVVRVVRRPQDDFALDVRQVPDQADLVVLGRPDNPTGRSEDLDLLRQLARPSRPLVVDEAFAEHAGDGLGLSAVRDDLPGLVQVRSLTKVWGAAGLRMGYVLADAATVRALASVLQPWPVGSVALAVITRLLGPDHRDEVERERRRRTAAVDTARARLVRALRALDLQVWAGETNYVLLRCPGRDLRADLLQHRVAVRRADTFPGLDASFVRVAVHPDPAVTDRLLDALGAVLAGR
ncbi:aminotransferase class I/II-fold pyridoxal phosphate-dependent enzyme [Aquipuribacter sp. MA13-6]|uniref:aminotransferase class I/II-fold pyridoxal phosphate-dependent enzyme n=1 Tax=unclassified Aquipuribacter TaxID=2635084 RepID=UPI003EEAD6B2